MRTQTKPEKLILSPFELAELLNLPREDAGLLSSAPVRLPAALVAELRDRDGPLELSLKQMATILGCPARTLGEWCHDGAIRARRVIGPGRGYRVSPDALIAFLRKRQETPPVVVESPTQRRRRAKGAKARAAEVLG